VPFFAYTILFLFLPAASVLIGAFQGTVHGYTFGNVRQLFNHPYIDAYKTSIEVSLVTAVIGGVAGLFIAYAAIREGTPRWIRAALTTFSGVAANFGGIPLAFAFIATLGPLGIITVFFRKHRHGKQNRHDHGTQTTHRAHSFPHSFRSIPLASPPLKHGDTASKNLK